MRSIKSDGQIGAARHLKPPAGDGNGREDGQEECADSCRGQLRCWSKINRATTTETDSRLARSMVIGEREGLLPERHVWESTAPAFRHHSDDHSANARPLRLRHDVWTILRYRASITHRSSLQRASYAFEASVLVLILLNVLLAMRESAVVAATDVHTDWYDTFLYTSTVIFSVEYALRLWSCVEDERFASPIIGRITWMLRPMSVIDLVVLVPFYLEIFFEHEFAASFRGILTLRGLRLLRIMSFLRLERSYNALKNLRELFTQKSEELWVVSYLTAVIVLTGSTTIFFLENPAQPEVFSSLGVCMWWCVETITSLGYGDIVPITGGGRFFSSILALWGIILFTIPGAILSSGYVEIMLQKQESEKQRIFQEELRQTFSRELHAMSTSGFKHGLFDIDDDEPPSSPTPRAQNVSKEQFEKLQDQVDQLTALQHQAQSQLRAQKAQLDAIQRLLEESNKRASRPPELPPFSTIKLPTAKGE